MHRIQTIFYSLIVLFTAAGCAGFDDFLEIPLAQEEPLVLFHNTVSPADTDTLVLMGIKEPYVYKGVDTVPLRFYLENENSELSLLHTKTRNISSFMPLIRVDADNASNIKRDFPELNDLTVFGIYLQGMTIDAAKLDQCKSLDDGSFRNITMRNAELLDERAVLFVSRTIDKERANAYKKLGLNTFSIHREGPY